MKVGDLVILRKGHYDFNGPWVWTDHLGAITDDRGFVDGTAEYKVYTVDNKHSWEHVDALRIPD